MVAVGMCLTALALRDERFYLLG
ncbi:protein of unknown function [Pseudodesulfovibrio piezophilus C1TLV30]|uniref:Uncharacterized protein n=1 Tax=Pseudodesulfovibrio piezophilus (strain DSM 21447 / JCM 15486 / C1TLV30) TaxID=1322246 RepID=M1WUZ8_PSEP2|nr:protein of unknown function [Pseudodesulfovibrio piezophilus C1TLV30]